VVIYEFSEKIFLNNTGFA